jgi:hypothetical protein
VNRYARVLEIAAQEFLIAFETVVIALVMLIEIKEVRDKVPQLHPFHKKYNSWKKIVG